MPRRSHQEPQPFEIRQFRDAAEIDRALKTLERRLVELAALDCQRAILEHRGELEVVQSNIRASILEIFGANSPEFHEHQHIGIWSGPVTMGMHPQQQIESREKGKREVAAILNGLMARLREKRELFEPGVSRPEAYFHQLNIHSRLAAVSSDLFTDSHHWEAVFAAAKALVNYVKERSGRHDLDGAPLMRTVFSKSAPLLAFNDLADQTDFDEQEGMMHLFEGAVLAIRNPGGHAFPEGTAQRALEYINLLSLLAYRTQEARRRK